MRKLFEKIWKKEEGFTLIELIIVIAILAIISAIAIPNVLSAVDNSRRTTDISNAKMIADAVATVRAKDENYAGESGVYNITDGTGTTPAFITEIVAQLNGVAPAPKYKGTSVVEDTFVLEIDTDGNITIYSAATGVDDAAGIAAAGAVKQVFPIPDTDYTNK